MGSGGSRLNAENEAMPAKLRPVFRRRIEEILRRRRSSAMKDRNYPSAKELLLDDKTGNDENDENVSQRKSVELDYKNNAAREMVLPPEEDSVASCVTSEGSKRSSSKGADGGKEEIREDKRKGEKRGDVVAKDGAAAEDVVEGGRGGSDRKEDEGDHNEDEEEDTEGRLSDDERMICPGSPSFRVYFIDNLVDDDEDDDDNEGCKKDGQSHETRSKDHKIHNTLVTSPIKESVGKQTAKKGRKRRSLKKVIVIPKGGQNAVKNLFNVRSCYTPSGSSHDRARLLTSGKTPA